MRGNKTFDEEVDEVGPAVDDMSQVRKALDQVMTKKQDVVDQHDNSDDEILIAVLRLEQLMTQQADSLDELRPVACSRQNHGHEASHDKDNLLRPIACDIACLRQNHGHEASHDDDA